MSNAKRNTTTSNTNVNQHDVRDTTNAFKFTTSNDVANIATSNNVVTLKQIIVDHKIKCDAKLIRRVLRKYYASQINHQHRDAWVFNTSHVDNIVKLIDTHCRSMKSSNA